MKQKGRRRKVLWEDEAPLAVVDRGLLGRVCEPALALELFDSETSGSVAEIVDFWRLNLIKGWNIADEGEDVVEYVDIRIEPDLREQK